MTVLRSVLLSVCLLLADGQSFDSNFISPFVPKMVGQQLAHTKSSFQPKQMPATASVKDGLKQLNALAAAIKDTLEQGREVMQVSSVFDQVLHAAQKSVHEMLDELLPVLRRTYAENARQLAELTTTFQSSLQLFVNVLSERLANDNFTASLSCDSLTPFMIVVDYGARFYVQLADIVIQANAFVRTPLLTGTLRLFKSATNTMVTQLTEASTSDVTRKCDDFRSRMLTVQQMLSALSFKFSLLEAMSADPTLRSRQKE